MPSEPTPEHFEDIVSAALKVDPAGLSGKHRKELTPEEAQREAVRINDLLGGAGWTPARITEWWDYGACEDLDGLTPLQAWNRAEYEKVRSLAESLAGSSPNR